MIEKNRYYSKIIGLAIVLILTAWSNTSIAKTYISNPEEAAIFVVDNVISVDMDEVLIYVWGPLSGGTDVSGLKEFIMQTPDEGYIVYVDLYPTANLFHPVQYFFVYESTGEYITKNAISPPMNLDEYKMIDTEIGELLFSVENRRAPINEFKTNSHINPSQDKWAVLMNGGVNSNNNHVRYWNDLSNIYITLTYEYDYADENIIVLCSDGLDPAPDQSNGLNSDPDLDGDGDDDIMYSCVLSNVDMVFNELTDIINEGDKLLIFTTDHGSSNGGWDVLLNLWNSEELTDAHFASLISNFPNCEIICTFEQCYSGGFLDDVVVPPGPIVASSACMHNQFSYAMGNLEYDEYVFHWTAALKGEDAYGNPVDADYNQDGIITMDEAFIYAEANDVQSEDPQYGDYPEDIGSSISLGISNVGPDAPEKPEGPRDGVVNNEYTYSTTTHDPEEDEIYYMWDWGDETYTDWLGPYAPGEEVFATKMWDEIGQYTIKVKAKDEPGMESNWSNPLVVNIVDKPVLEIGNITGGFKINAVVINSGAEAVGVDTKINIDDGLVILGREKINKIPYINSNSQKTITSNSILGFGNVKITVEASIEDVYASKTVDGFIILFYVVVT